MFVVLHFSLKEDQYLDTNGFLDAVKEEFERNWSKWGVSVSISPQYCDFVKILDCSVCKLCDSQSVGSQLHFRFLHGPCKLGRERLCCEECFSFVIGMFWATSQCVVCTSDRTRVSRQVLLRSVAYVSYVWGPLMPKLNRSVHCLWLYKSFVCCYPDGKFCCSHLVYCL